MIQGRAHRKTMKRHRLNPLSLLQVSKPPGKQWSSTAHAPLDGDQRRTLGRKHRWKYQRHANGRNTATSPPACALADRNLHSRLRGGGGREGVSKQRVETAVETAVMIRGRTRRKTMKRHCLIPCLSSKENEENTGQAMAINAPPHAVESKVGQRWKHR